MKKPLGWAILAACLLVALGPTRAAFASPAVPDIVPLPPDRVAQLAKPATVLIETGVSGTFSMPVPTDDEATYRRIFEADPTVRAAAARGDDRALFNRIYELMAQRPNDFLGPVFTEPIDETSVGTGFLVGSAGIVLTNSHVVYGDGTAQAFLDAGFEEETPEIAEGILPRGIPVDAAVLQKATEALAGAMKAKAKITNFTRTVTVRHLDATGAQMAPATVLRTTEPYPGPDLAVLEVKSLAGRPSLELATTEPRVGEEAYALGFPGAATFGSGTDERSQLVPSLTKGVVSATKTSEKGVAVVQVDASLAPGNSGGPLLNDQGEVVGINVIGADSPGNFNFAISAQRARSYLTEGNTALDRSASSESLENAVRSLHAGWLKAAGKHIVELGTEAPHTLALNDLQGELDGRVARKERDLTPSDVNVLVPGAFAGGLLALVTMGTVASGVMRSRRRPRQPALAPMTGTVSAEDLSIWTRSG